MRLESWQPSRHSTGCLTARLVTELTCLDASREVGAEHASASELLSTAETGAEKLQRGSEVAPALTPHRKSKYFLPNNVTGASLAHLQRCFTVFEVTETPGTHFTWFLCPFSFASFPLWLRQKASATLSPLLSLICMSIIIKILLQVTLVLMWNPARFVLVTFYWPSIDLFKQLFPLKRWSSACARDVGADTELWLMLFASWKQGFSLQEH